MSKLELQKCILGSVSTNCYFAKNTETGEILILDPGDAPERIYAKISAMGGSPAAILLTHGHYDHILAVSDVREKYGIQVYACQAEQELLENPSANLTRYTGKPVTLKADVLLSDGQVFEAAGFSIKLFHTPGHTKGSCCYYIEEEGVLFSGDTLFCGSVGRTDFPGGSTSEIVRSLHRLLDTLPEETDIFPGHEQSTTIGYEKRYNPFV
ncbi:MAG: MBL fold metallo-hydrolase [Clostridiales bacterium]|nr:MBL fold metallo-hydrolase [Clostridiales bacterium]